MPHEVDVHPDDLLHRARGDRALSRDEQAYVDAHVQDCGTCRFLLDAGRAFDAEAAAPSPVIKLDRLVARTLRRTGMDRGRRSRQPSRRLAVAGLGAALMLGGVAFAGYLGRASSGARAGPLVVVAAPMPPRAPRSARRGLRGTLSTPDDDSPAAADSEAAPAPAPARSRPTAPPGRRLALKRAPQAPATAGALFAAANRARRLGDAGGGRAGVRRAVGQVPRQPGGGRVTRDLRPLDVGPRSAVGGHLALSGVSGGQPGRQLDGRGAGRARRRRRAGRPTCGRNRDVAPLAGRAPDCQRTPRARAIGFARWMAEPCRDGATGVILPRRCRSRRVVRRCRARRHLGRAVAHHHAAGGRLARRGPRDAGDAGRSSVAGRHRHRRRADRRTDRAGRRGG